MLTLALSEPSSNTVLITTIGGFLTLIATRYFDNRRAEHARMDDRDERAATAEALSQTVELARIKLATENREQRAVLAQKIDQAGEHAQAAHKEASAAYKEANDLNQKIDNVGIDNVAGNARIEKILIGRTPMLSETHHAAVDTNELLNEPVVKRKGKHAHK